MKNHRNSTSEKQVNLLDEETRNFIKRRFGNYNDTTKSVNKTPKRQKRNKWYISLGNPEIIKNE